MLTLQFFRFPILCSVWKLERFKAQQSRLVSKIEAKFRTFWLSPCKNEGSGSLGELSEWNVWATSRIRPLLYVWRGAAEPSRRLEGRWKVEQGVTSHQTHIGNVFYGSNDPTNSVKALKKDRLLSIRFNPSVSHHRVTIIQHICRWK